MPALTHAAIVRKFTKHNLTVHSDHVKSDWGGFTNYWADSETDRISWSVRDGEDRIQCSLYVKPHNAKDDPMSDYFAGSFASSIDQALRFADVLSY